MKIAIDVTQIIYGTGVSVYVKNLVSNLLQIDNSNRYVLFAGSLRRQNELRELKSQLRGNFTLKVNRISPTVADIVWNKLHTLPIESIIGNVDVLHTSDWSEPPSQAYKVTTIHDLSPILYPKYTNQKIVEVFKRKLKWVKKETAMIIVPTETTKGDLLNLGFDESKIKVIYEGLNPLFEKKHVGKGDYLLAVGTAPRKNLSNIAAAFKQLKKEGLVEELLVVGQKPENPEEGVSYTGMISDEKLGELYAGAKALVYPSLYEGFGLPILEAFSQDCPVVTSNLGSMKEVARDAAILVEPTATDSIIDGIVRAIKNRDALIKKGRSRLKDFSWEKAAKETLKVYEQRK